VKLTAGIREGNN